MGGYGQIDIAVIPKPGNDDDAECVFCKRPCVAVVKGGENCNMCGNQINLCVTCALTLSRELSEIIVYKL